MNFDKYFNRYDDYSYVQKKVAANLAVYMEENKIFEKAFLSIFEIGCGTGIFTKLYREKFSKLETLILNDKFDVKNYIAGIDYERFIQGDVLELEIPKTDLILSSSVFQWINDFDLLFQKLSKSSGNLCFSSYIQGNLIEIKEHFGLSLDYKKVEDMEKILKKYYRKVIYKKESIRLDFESPIALLKHLKYTGVTGLQKPAVTNIRSFKDKTLTYEVAYFICEK